VSVITDREIWDRQVSEAAEAIRVVPGVFVQKGGPSGAPTSVFLRGAASNQAVVLVDGVKVNDPTIGGQFNFYDLGLENMQSIEVMRGSSSTLYGSEAIGGVVNLVTRTGERDLGGRGVLEGGTFGYYQFAAGAWYGMQAVEFSVETGARRWENDVPNNAFEQEAIAARLATTAEGGVQLNVAGRIWSSKAEDPWDFPLGDQIEEDDNIRRDRRTGVGRVAVRHDFTDDFTWTLSASYFDVDSKFTNGPDAAGAADELVSRSSGRIGTVTWTGTLGLPDLLTGVDLSLLPGLEYEHETSENRVSSAWGDNPPLDRTVRNRAAFLLAEIAYAGRLVLSGGVRRDDNSWYGGVTTGTGSLLYHLEETGTRFRANYGQGFRGPKPAELDDPFVGNPDLDPEESVSYDLGIEQELLDAALVLEVVWFHLRTKDLVAYDPETFRLENFDRTRTRGFELALAYRPTDEWSVRTWWTIQDPVDLTAEPGEEDQLPGRPKWFGGGEVAYAGLGWSAGLSVNASDDYPGPVRVTPDGTVRNHPGRKLLIGLRGAVDLATGVALTGRVENLLDDEWYDDPNRPNGLGRGFYMGLDFSF